MKKFFIIFSTFLLLILNLNILNVKASTSPNTFTQGIYSARDANLVIGTPITVRITSPNDSALLLVIDSKQYIQEMVRLGPQLLEHTLRPLDYDFSIIIFTNGSVTFS